MYQYFPLASNIFFDSLLIDVSLSMNQRCLLFSVLTLAMWKSVSNLKCLSLFSYVQDNTWAANLPEISRIKRGNVYENALKSLKDYCCYLVVSYTNH